MREENENPFEERSEAQSHLSVADDAFKNAQELAVMASNPVLVIVDANKEVSTHALEWALTHVIQKGDSVKLLGVLHHILNPMGYKSRADEKSWNGANRKVLENEIAIHLAIFESIPHIYEIVEKLGAKLEIEVRAHVHPKYLVVEEAKKLKARYVVIDRHIKKDKKFYIKNLSCYVTRVKTVVNFEHLRHGLPETEEPVEAVQAPAVSKIALDRPQMPALQDSSTITMPQSRSISQQHQSKEPLLPSSDFMARMRRRPGDYNPYNTGLTSAATAMRGRFSYGPRPSFNMADATRELAARQCLAHSSCASDPALYSRNSELGHMAIGYPENSVGDPTSPPQTPAVTEFLAGYRLNLCYQGMGNALPPMSMHKPKPNRMSQSSSMYLTSKSSHDRHFNLFQHPSEAAALESTGPESAVAELRSITSKMSLSDKSHGGPMPISVQPKRVADANWGLELLGVGNTVVQASGMTEEPTPVDSKDQSELGRSSSVRQAVGSRIQSPGAPPLCSLCGQKSPDFSKVKRFTFLELQKATNNFSGEHYLAEGVYGSVYKGRLKDGQLVAVKQHKLATSLSDEQFAAEVEALSCAQHRNLVTLIGYCVENKLRLLVYEYICNGSLDRHLSPKSKSGLQWKHRIKIALGAASALRYLHEECRVGCIIHRDMRPNNILLTHDFTPMVGDFGLARRQPSGDEAEETRVLGTAGYLAPEYAETGKITDKADVYAFGVVLLELISGRKAIDNSRPRDQMFLTEWARPLLESYNLSQLVDPRLGNNFDEYEMHCMMHAANQCIKKDRLMRPRMIQVLRILNPPEESDWIYKGSKSNASPGDRSPRGAMASPSDSELSSCPVSSRNSTGVSCSQSEASTGSYSGASDTESVACAPRSKLSKLGSKSIWRTFSREKLSCDGSFRDIAAVNRMSCDSDML